MAISIPHSFTNDTIAEAAEVNANFNAVATFVNNLQDGTLIDSNAITTAKIASSAVTSAKIAPEAVTTSKLAALSVTGEKLANLSSSTKTGSYTLVAADRNTIVVMNSSSDTTITVDTGLFAAGDVVYFQNIGSGICTITAGTATVNSSCSLSIRQWAGGSLYFSSASSAIFSNNVEPGLSLVSSTTIGSAVSSVTVNNAFSSTYDNYKVLVSGGAGSTSLSLAITFGATSSNYYAVSYYVLYSNATSNITNVNNGSSIPRVAGASTTGLNGVIDIISPNLAEHTYVSANGNFSDQGGAGFSHGYLANTTQYTSFTLTCSTGNLTGGTIKVYGYRN